MNPALIDRASAILGDPIRGEFGGTMSDAVDVMTAFAFGVLQEHPNGTAQTRLTSMLRASSPDRVAELCAAALLRLAAGGGSADLPAGRHRGGQCGECKASVDTRHLDGCSWQYGEEWVSGRAVPVAEVDR